MKPSASVVWRPGRLQRTGLAVGAFGTEVPGQVGPEAPTPVAGARGSWSESPRD